ncbi:MAG: hypothetical protein PHE77_02235 [Candidatus Pacebacteria bacterium]|nr:hypothetical protein [Candidatus Paceibacterota bacterium]
MKRRYTVTNQEVLKAFYGLNNGAMVVCESTRFGGEICGEITAVCCHDKSDDSFSIKIAQNGNVPRKVFLADIFFLKRIN